MLNIEIHGFGVCQTYFWPPGAVELEGRIVQLMAAKPYAKDVVVTIFPSLTEDTHAEIRPFLRIVTTPEPYLDDTVAALQRLGVYIEVSLLEKFFPAKKPDS